MQDVRGFVFFEGKSIEEIKSKFNGFKLDCLKYSFFDNFLRDNSHSKDSGIFIYGEVDEKYSSKDIITILRRHIGLGEPEFKEKRVNSKIHYTPISFACDVSVAGEDVMKRIKSSNERINGNYFGIRIKPPLSLPEVEERAKNLGISTEADDVYLRGVEIDETIKDLPKELPKLCVEIVTGIAYEKAKKGIEEAFGCRYKDKIEDIRATRLFT
jgi:hypothetical protein